jgi:hypothetical protein
VLQKVRINFRNGTLDGPNGPFADVHDSLTFYMTPEEVGKVVAMALERGVTVEVMSYFVTSAEQALKEVEQKIAKGNSFAHKNRVA